MSKFIEARGLSKAKAQMDWLAKMGARISGVHLPGSARNDTGATNGEIIDYLAEGGRDIRADQEDADKAAMAFKVQVELALNKIKDVPRGSAKVQQEAAKAWRAAGRVIKEIMRERVDQGKVQGGGDASKVSEDYAAQRLRKYGIPEDIVFKATGQLLSNLSQGDGALKLTTKGSG